jgi:hypothetical protein
MFQMIGGGNKEEGIGFSKENLEVARENLQKIGDDSV